MSQENESIGLFGLDWVWVIYGTALITTLQFSLLAVAGMTFLGDQIASAISSPNSANFGWVATQAGALAAVGYLVGGILVGRMSSAKTIIEPAVAAGIPAAVLFVYILTKAQRELSASGVFWYFFFFAGLAVLFCFFVALLGGYLGERWQERAQR